MSLTIFCEYVCIYEFVFPVSLKFAVENVYLLLYIILHMYANMAFRQLGWYNPSGSRNISVIAVVHMYFTNFPLIFTMSNGNKF